MAKLTPAPTSTRESIHYFETFEEAISYREEHGTGGWIFACADKGEGIIFPPTWTPNRILQSGMTSLSGGRFIGQTGKVIRQEDV